MFNLLFGADGTGTTFPLLFGMMLVTLVIAILLSSDLATTKHKYALKLSYLGFSAFIVVAVTMSVSALAQFSQPRPWSFVSANDCDCPCDVLADEPD